MSAQIMDPEAAVVVDTLSSAKTRPLAYPSLVGEVEGAPVATHAGRNRAETACSKGSKWISSAPRRIWPRPRLQGLEVVASDQLDQNQAGLRVARQALLQNRFDLAVVVRELQDIELLRT